MQIDGYVQALREDLVRVAALGDETTARAAELLAVALESSVARRLQEVLGEAALEVSSQLDSSRVEVRIVGGDPELVVVRDQEAEPAAAGDDILDARITLRLPDALKRRVEELATKDGISVNTWIVHAVARNAHAARRSSGKRLTGYGRS